ncbi:hypothetical protein GCM10023219_28360 [Stakelama sediminis]|uniref:Cell shape-determining protein MreC n=1 Tax=Stakelama sediminis TaxID=463200 RepID=A0A840YY69_9SPHN|nr:rod shape-determining protein MreC [Stakelama sediminis]MBB5718479.1 rod shape-determining protein MreC [Stakelama sediminis]
MAAPRNRRPGFSRRAQYGLFISYVVAGVGAVIALVLILLARYNPPAYAVARGAIREVTTPVSAGLDNVRRGIGGIPGAIGAHFHTISENRALKAELAKQADQIQRARSLTLENQRLRMLLKLRDGNPQVVVAARIVSSSATSTRRYAVLYAGSRQGVRPRQPVRGPRGLIGRVLETGPDSALVMLVLDPESVVPARRIRDGLPVLISGRGDGLVDIKSASVANAPFLKGDTFVTSGTGGIYPPDIPVARAAENGKDTVEGRVFASPDSVDFALVQQAFLPQQMTKTATDQEAPPGDVP